MKPRPQEWPHDGTLPANVQEFLEWLLTPTFDREPRTQAEWGRQHGGIHPNTMSQWKRDKRFREAFDKRAQELNLSPYRIQEVLDGVFKAAASGDMKAAQLYLQHVNQLAPKRLVIEDRSIAALSDAELREALSAEGLLA